MTPYITMNHIPKPERKAKRKDQWQEEGQVPSISRDSSWDSLTGAPKAPHITLPSGDPLVPKPIQTPSIGMPNRVIYEDAPVEPVIRQAPDQGRRPGLHPNAIRQIQAQYDDTSLLASSEALQQRFGVFQQDLERSWLDWRSRRREWQTTTVPDFEIKPDYNPLIADKVSAILTSLSKARVEPAKEDDYIREALRRHEQMMRLVQDNIRIPGEHDGLTVGLQPGAFEFIQENGPALIETVSVAHRLLKATGYDHELATGEDLPTCMLNHGIDATLDLDGPTDLLPDLLGALGTGLSFVSRYKREQKKQEGDLRAFSRTSSEFVSQNAITWGLAAGGTCLLGPLAAVPAVGVLFGVLCGAAARWLIKRASGE